MLSQAANVFHRTSSNTTQHHDNYDQDDGDDYNKDDDDFIVIFKMNDFDADGVVYVCPESA